MVYRNHFGFNLRLLTISNQYPSDVLIFHLIFNVQFSRNSVFADKNLLDIHGLATLLITIRFNRNQWR